MSEVLIRMNHIYISKHYIIQYVTTTTEGSNTIVVHGWLWWVLHEIKMIGLDLPKLALVADYLFPQVHMFYPKVSLGLFYGSIFLSLIHCL